MKPGQEFMIWFCFSKENNSSPRVILKIELELNNLNSILSRLAVTPVFPLFKKTTQHRFHMGFLRESFVFLGYHVPQKEDRKARQKKQKVPEYPKYSRNEKYEQEYI